MECVRPRFPPQGVAVARSARHFSAWLPVAYTLFTTWKTRLMLTSRERSFKATLGQKVIKINEFSSSSILVPFNVIYGSFVDVALASRRLADKANAVASCRVCDVTYIWCLIRGMSSQLLLVVLQWDWRRMFSPRAVHTVCVEEQCWDTGKILWSGWPLWFTFNRVTYAGCDRCLCCAALGTGQLHHPRKQTGHRANAAGRTLSFFKERNVAIIWHYK